MTKGIRVYVHSLRDGKRWRRHYNYPSHYSISRCLALAGAKLSDTTHIKGVGFEEGALTLHVHAG